MRRRHATTGCFQLPRDRCAGFTMMELMTVIIIMFMLMGLAVGGYVGMLRGARLKGSVSILHNLITMARQQAITEQSSTFVMFDQDGTNASITVAAQYGVCRKVNGNRVTANEALPYASEDMKGGIIYNLDKQSGWKIANLLKDEVGDTIITTIELGAQVVGSGSWQDGDRFGFAIHAVEYTPENVIFGNGSSEDAPAVIIFYSDGTTPLKGGSYSMEMSELYAKPRSVWTIEVVGLTGKVVTELSAAADLLTP
jgi:Tfp pilus assembly protein FimT